jgi:hypothetical protein
MYFACGSTMSSSFAISVSNEHQTAKCIGGSYAFATARVTGVFAEAIDDLDIL